MNYTDTESKVREATNDEPWGPTGNIMQELALATFSYEYYPEVMSMLWRRMLLENQSNYRRTYKALVVLTYLVKNGDERVVTNAREHVYDLKSLKNYSYVEESGKDVGINVRIKVKQLVDLIQDDATLREERKKAKSNRDRYVGVSGRSMSHRRKSRWVEIANKFALIFHIETISQRALLVPIYRCYKTHASNRSYNFLLQF